MSIQPCDDYSAAHDSTSCDNCGAPALAHRFSTEKVPTIAPNRETLGADGTVRKAHYGEGEQPWDTSLANGWGPHAAAFCVLRYLRRDKLPEHSLESAKWYYARLYELSAKEYESNTQGDRYCGSEAQTTLVRLELCLTQDEIKRLRS